MMSATTQPSRSIAALLAARFVSALLLDDFVIGGGNAKKLKKAPPGCRLGNNANAFLGGFRMWEKSIGQQPSPRPGTRNDRKASKGA